MITTLAGTGVAGFSGDTGQASAAQLNTPRGVAADAAGNVYIADRNNHRVRKVDPAGVITTLAGTGVAGFSGDTGQASLARLNNPEGVAADAAGTVYIADSDNHRVRKVSAVAPTAAFSANPTSGPAPLTVSFDASGSSDPNGTIVSYAWAFGDTQSGSGAQTSHTYTGAGTFTATLTVTDNDGATGQSSQTITVTGGGEAEAGARARSPAPPLATSSTAPRGRMSSAASAAPTSSTAGAAPTSSAAAGAPTSSAAAAVLTACSAAGAPTPCSAAGAETQATAAPASTPAGASRSASTARSTSKRDRFQNALQDDTTGRSFFPGQA